MYIRSFQTAKPPKWIISDGHIFIKLKKRIRRIMKKVYSLFRKKVWILEAADTNCVHNDTILFVGRDLNRDYFGKLFFKNYTHRLIGHRWLWQVFFPKDKIYKNCSFSVMQTKWRMDSFCRSKMMFFVPAWIYGRVDITSNFDTYLKKNKSVKNNLRKIKKGQFSVEISSDPKAFEEFYFKMHQPYISKRYGEGAINRKYDQMKDLFIKHNEILFITKDSQRIAGLMICYLESGMPQLYVLGVRDGDFNWVSQGAISALYLNTIIYFQSKGFKKICLGGTRPFFSDGVLNYKLNNWNMKIEDYAKESYFLIKQHRASAFAQEFLSENPFISIKKGKMIINSFIRENNENNDATNDKLNKYVQNGSSK